MLKHRWESYGSGLLKFSECFLNLLNSNYTFKKNGATNVGKTQMTFDTCNTSPNYNFYTLSHFNLSKLHSKQHPALLAPRQVIFLTSLISIYLLSSFSLETLSLSLTPHLPHEYQAGATFTVSLSLLSFPIYTVGFQG